MLGVWIAPVTAQLMMTLPAMGSLRVRFDPPICTDAVPAARGTVG
jgi:hypothetical protein